MGDPPVKSLYSWDTQFSADSAEFCPVEPLQDVLAVGTYQLADPDSHPDGSDASNLPKKRLGRLYLKQMKDKSLVLLQQIDMPAILDMKWSCHRVCGNVLLAVANAIGQLLVYKLECGRDDPQLSLLCQHTIDEADTLALSLDWSNRKHSTNQPLIAISDSKGKVSLLQLTNNEVKPLQRFKAHEYEAWIAAFNYWNDNILYTGGDDGKLRCFDLRDSAAATPVFTNRTQHSAGVTSIHAATNTEHTVASGSYDECVCLWDTRTPKRPVCDAGLGGGVWRLKWEPGPEVLLLAACMHNGCHVVDTSDSVLQTKASFTAHQSLAYGADWYWPAAVEPGSDTRVVASASFYDHLLCLWEFSIN